MCNIGMKRLLSRRGSLSCSLCEHTFSSFYKHFFLRNKKWFLTFLKLERLVVLMPCLIFPLSRASHTIWPHDVWAPAEMGAQKAGGEVLPTPRRLSHWKQRSGWEHSHLTGNRPRLAHYRSPLIGWQWLNVLHSLFSGLHHVKERDKHILAEQCRVLFLIQFCYAFHKTNDLLSSFKSVSAFRLQWAKHCHLGKVCYSKIKSDTIFKWYSWNELEAYLKLSM